MPLNGSGEHGDFVLEEKPGPELFNCNSIKLDSDLMKYRSKP
jgi:hypothetical protein